MDSNLLQAKSVRGDLTQEELFEQILSLPCLYGVLENQSQIFCVDLENQESNEIMTVLLAYSSFESAMQALEEFKIIPGEYAESYIAHWTSIDDAMDLFSALNLDGIAIDLFPDGQVMEGVILDRPLIADMMDYMLE